MTLSVTAALTAFIERYMREMQQKRKSLPRQEYDPAWPSCCQLGEPDTSGMITWRPVKRDQPADFSGLEYAFETTLHEDIKHYYGSFWSDGLAADCKEGEVNLILIWNEDDFQRLIGNIIGHALAKRRAKQPLTVFFACTEADSELFLSIDNTSGKVLLEQPGIPPLREVAPSLSHFIARLRPAVERMTV